MAEQFANNAASTLNGAINNSTTTIVVATGEGSRFPSVGNFRLMIGLDPFTAEIVLATARSGDTITVVRGQEGTSAQSWGNGTSVTHIVTAGAIEQIRTQFVTSGAEIYTTNTVSIDPNGTVASSHGDGTSKLYVNGNVQALRYSAGEMAAVTQGFGYVSDTLQSFVVPTGVTSLKVKMWGPGGGTGSYSASGGGGPGGYTTGFLSVTPGETLLLAVGSGGKKPVSSTGNGGLGGWPGGGFGTRGDASGGGGGGLTGIFTSSMTQANALMIAGGGGGSTGFGNFGAGGGGGLTGGSGTSGSGAGGSQVAGGLGGGTLNTSPSVGTALAGGTAFTDNTTSQTNDCGGGGSGYWGGGAGQGDGRAGGGGSGFIHATRVSSGSTTTGNNAVSGNAQTLPPNTTDPNYIAGVGVGAATGLTGVGNDGGDGYIVFQWGGQTSMDLDSINFSNGSIISIPDNHVSIASGGGNVVLSPGSSSITLQSATDFILSTLTDTRFDISSSQKFKMYSSGAVVIGTATNNDTSAEAQAGITGPIINISSSTGSISTTTNQATIFNQSGALYLQGNTEVRFATSTSTKGYFDVNGIFRAGPSASSTATLQGATWPITGTDYFWMYNASGSSWAEIVAGGSVNRSAIQVLNNATSNTCGVSLFGAGTGHGTAEYAGNGTIEQSGNSTSALVFTKRNGTDGLSFASTGAIWQSGAWTIGRATNNDTSSEAQAGLTGPLLNITQTTGGTLTTVANQSLLYNSAGVNISQGHSGVRQIVGTTTILDTTSTGTTITGLVTATNKFVVGTSGPTITQGTGVPATSENNGSIFLRTDGTASTGIYTRQGGAWYSINSRYTPTDSNTIINWKFDETAAPYVNSGSGSSLSLTTFTGTPVSITGLFNKGLGCSLSTITTGNTSVNEPTGNSLTVSAWVKARSYATFATVINKAYRNDNTWSSPFVALYLSLTNSGDGSWGPAITTTGGVLTQPAIGGAFRVPLHVWTLLSYTYDGTTLRSYINGALAHSVNVSGSIDYGTHGPWDVGGVSNASVGQFWDGHIDDVRVENVVRSQAYFEEMYKRGIGQPD